VKMKQEKERYIVHVDMDAFFAAVEQRDNPEYRGRPVVVGADPKGGAGRGVVSTCSYEARRYGLRSAMPISQAYRKCPQAVFLPVDMEKYSLVSEKVLSILNSFSPLVEQVSIDEAFLDISSSYKLHGAPYLACTAMKKRIKEETGLTASVGLAPNKMAAKIASDLCKPDGLLEVTAPGLREFLDPLDVGLLWGVGEKTKSSLNALGIRTIGELGRKTRQELTGLFGRNGVWFWEAGRGMDDSEVVPEREAKSVGNESTFEEDTGDRKTVEGELFRLCELVSDRMREKGVKGSTVTLKIRLEGFLTYTRSRTLAEPTNFTEDLIRAARYLFGGFSCRGKKIRLVGVKVSNLSEADEPLLFEPEGGQKREKAHKAVDRIKKKFGRECISQASGAVLEKRRFST
jgi:DNA polymerase-4